MIIELEFENTLTNLADFRFGGEIFRKQIKKKISKDEKNVIVFPDQIEDIAISFIQGMYDGIIKTIGKENAMSKVEIKTKTQELTQKIINAANAIN